MPRNHPARDPWSLHLLRVALLLGCAFATLPSLPAATPQPVVPAAARTDRLIVRPAARARQSDLERENTAAGARVLKEFGRDHAGRIMEVPRGTSAAITADRLRRSGLYDYVEPDYLLRVFAVPNDFNYLNQDQWSLHNTGVYGGKAGADIMAESGWDLLHDAPGITVAVVDTGLRLTHEDLAPNLWTNPGETGLDAKGRDKATNGIDDDNNGYVDDVHGINVLTGSGDPSDDWGHGSHVAGIIGAAANNGVGIAGVAWKVKLMGVKFISSTAQYSVSDAITALEYARLNGAKIITACWGNYAFDSAALRSEMALLRNAGILVIAAAGNDNSDNDVTPLYPAGYDFDNIVAVAATTRTDNRAGFSNYGLRSVALGAPGSPIFSTWAGTDRDYRYLDGTSMAAPHVAGAAALLWTRFATDTYAQVIQRILTTVDPLPDLRGRTRSGGRLNLAAALATGAAIQPPTAPASLTATATGASTVTLAWTDRATTETNYEVQRSTDGTTFTALPLLGANATAFTDTGLAASTTYTYRVRALVGPLPSDFSNLAQARTATPPPPNTGWTSADIGAVGAAGSSTDTGGIVTVNGSGADIWDRADEFHFRYLPFNGDGSITARVTGLTNVNGWAKAGVMIRETLDTGSRHAHALVSVSNGIALQSRTTTGGNSATVSGTNSSAPRWVRLVRAGDTLSGYESANGSTWTLIGTVTLNALPAGIYAGLAVTSHRDGTICTATFEQVYAAGSTPPATLTAPTSLTATPASANRIDLAWTDRSPDETGFEVERGTDGLTFTLLASTPANSTTYADTTCAPSTTYWYRVRASAGTTRSSYTTPVSTTTPASVTPGNWTSADLGSPRLAGSGTLASGTWTLRGAGADIWDTADAGQFTSQSFTGDFTVQARVMSFSATHPWAKAGLMVRESTAAGARNVFAFLTPSNGMAAQARTTAGGATTQQRGTWWVAAPHWVRINRTANRFTVSDSFDGLTWTVVQTTDLILPTTVLVGMAVTSHDDTQLATALLDNVGLR